MAACTVCKGSKVNVIASFISLEGKVYPERRYVCSSCHGVGEFPEIDRETILNLITARQGKNKGKLRAAMTSPIGSANVNSKRAYYVWRLARFSGGKDTTLPVMADLVVRGDPFKKELDNLSDEVAKQTFGSDMAGAYRWGRALGYIG